MMTNREYLQKSLSGFGVSDDDIELILVRGGVCPDNDVCYRSCDEALYNRLSVVLGMASKNVSEGGYSISWNIEALKLFYRALCSELGKPNELRPKVRNRSHFW